jgi:SAM-dependent methyltransferase
VSRDWVFDMSFAVDYTKARQDVVGRLLADLRQPLELSSALDLGCGVGHFSKYLSDLGFRVVAVDGREENTAEARTRYPEITFITKNAEDSDLVRLGTFDFVLCVGLLYHLENPFRTIRSLFALTGKIMVVEAMCAPSKEPTLYLVDEERGEDQALNYIAFYPTQSCLIKMLYRSGFPHVYEFKKLPSHERFHASFWRRRDRTMLVASKVALPETTIRSLADTRGSWEILSTRRERLAKQYRRIVRYLSLGRIQGRAHG